MLTMFAMCRCAHFVRNVQMCECVNVKMKSYLFILQMCRNKFLMCDDVIKWYSHYICLLQMLDNE